MCLPPNALNRHIFSSPSWSKMERGIVSPEEFVALYNSELDQLAPEDGLKRVKGVASPHLLSDIVFARHTNTARISSRPLRYTQASRC